MKRFVYEARICQVVLIPGKPAEDSLPHMAALIKGNRKSAVMQAARAHAKLLRSMADSITHLQTDITLTNFGRKFDREEYLTFRIYPNTKTCRNIGRDPAARNKCYAATANRASILALFVLVGACIGFAWMANIFKAALVKSIVYKTDEPELTDILQRKADTTMDQFFGRVRRAM